MTYEEKVAMEIARQTAIVERLESTLQTVPANLRESQSTVIGILREIIAAMEAENPAPAKTVAKQTVSEPLPSNKTLLGTLKNMFKK